VGRLLAAFGGGGHRGAASARFPAALAQEYLSRIIAALEQNR
jgi:nanoRNase/pAp phosphatase (c-di-AMP/oligoRNAs hydrolase)